MTKEEMRKMVAAYFEDTMALAEDARADGSGVLPEESEDGSNEALDGLEFHLSDLMEDLAKGKHGAVASVADSILACAGVTIDKASHEYRVLCRETLKGVIAATKIQLKRMQGHYEDEQSAGRSNATLKEKPALPQSVLLSAALAEYVKEHDASGHWREKTREESEGVYRLLVGIIGDRDMAELDYKMLSGFRDSLIRFPSNHTKQKAYRGKSVAEILALTLKTKASNPLSVSSVNKHIIRTGAFLKWAVKRDMSLRTTPRD